MSRIQSPDAVKFETMKTMIAAKLLDDPAWVEKAILVLYERQTADEQAGGETRHDNNQGFTSADARRMSFVAEWLRKSKRNHLSREKALGTYGRRLQKYAGQLARIALAKTPPQAPTAVQRPENRCYGCGVVRCPDGCCCAC